MCNQFLYRGHAVKAQWYQEHTEAGGEPGTGDNYFKYIISLILEKSTFSYKMVVVLLVILQI